MGDLLDSVDWKILKTISHDARLPVSQIAREVGIKRETVKYRLNKLRTSGVVRHFLTYVDFAKVGYPIWGYMHISFKDLNSDREVEFDKYVKKNPYVIFAYKAFGEYDYGIEFFAKTPQQLYEIQLDLKKQFSGIIKDMRTGSIIESTKINYVPYFK